MSAGPVSAPAWAVEMAREFCAGYFHDGEVERLARLLASVREGALRGAAGVASDRRIVLALGPRRPKVNIDSFNAGCSDCADAILSLLTTPPREATR